MILDLVSTNKKRNSTKIITSFSKTISDVKLKENTSLTTPVFRISRNALDFLDVIPSYNYIRLKTSGSNTYYYYFIDTWEADVQSSYLIHCTMDVLATFKSSITSQTLYVLRSASDYDTNVVDTLYPVTTGFTHNSNIFSGTVNVKDPISGDNYNSQASVYFNTTLYSGFFYLKIVDDSADIGTTIHVFEYNQFKTFLSKIFTIDFSSEFPEIANGVALGVANPLQYITECYWMPFYPPQGSFTAKTIKLGPYSVPGTYTSIKLDNPIKTEITFSMDNSSKHPQITRGKYLHTNPYTNKTFRFYPFGIYSLNDPTMANAGNTLDVNIIVDNYTGEAILKVSSNGFIYVSDTKKYSIPIQINETSLSVLGAVGATLQGNAKTTNLYKNFGGASTSFATLLAKAVDYEPFLNAQEQAPSGIGSILQSAGTEIHTNGTFGAVAPYSIKPSIESDYANIVDEDLTHNGRPLCQDVTLNTLSGFCQCKDADIEISNATNDQLQMIMNYLTGGFFIE